MKRFAKTKIIATIGPSSWDDNILRNMVEEGMDIARINASFADFDEIIRVSQQIKNISPKIAVMIDTEGNKIRINGFDQEIEIREGQLIALTGDMSIPNCLHVSYENLHKDVTRDSVILIDDGKIKLSVKDIKDKVVFCHIDHGGILKKQKTVNIPGAKLSFPTISEKDKADIVFAVKNNLDFISASFVRDAEDIKQIRELMGNSKTKLIAKIENEEGVKNIDQIIEDSDGIMIARGDLGVEVPFEKVPVIQKKIIYKCRLKGKPVIVATQMLESMKTEISPTRAEVSDIANAVMDGTDALMLSAETSTGDHPVESVRVMNTIAMEAENALTSQKIFGHTDASDETDEICRNLLDISSSLNLKGIIVLCNTGSTVASLSRHRFKIPIWSLSSDPMLIRQLNIFRGVKSFYARNFSRDRDEAVQRAVETVYAYGELEIDDKIAIISGSSLRYSSPNTSLEIFTVKDVLGR
jgi:pyruvate kinase